VVTRDLRDWIVPKDLAFDRTTWKSAIHLLVLVPYVYVEFHISGIPT
jgi:hypothetical protein